jgi:uncharacterized membrane protein YdjX (TVP38/TMEM64 family)
MQENNRLSLIEFVGLIIGLLLLMILGRYLHIDFPALQQTLRKLPFFLSGTVFVILYVLLTFFIWFSKDILRIMAAVVFGAYFSTFLVWIAEIVNGCILFLLARRLGRDFVAGALKVRHERLDDTLSKTSFFWLFMLRATPLVPFRFFDLGCGLTALSFRKYLSVIVMGSLPRIFWLQYVLAGVGIGLLKNPQAILDYLSANPKGFIFTFIYLVLVCVVAWKMKKKGKP